MTNKKLGNDFETDLCNLLSKEGFWVHNFAQNRDGQPADVIAVRNKVAYLIDCKVCTRSGFALRRVEENQELSMSLWDACRNGTGWFAVKVGAEIFMIPLIAIKGYRESHSTMSEREVRKHGTPLDLWVEICK